MTAKEFVLAHEPTANIYQEEDDNGELFFIKPASKNFLSCEETENKAWESAAERIARKIVRGYDNRAAAFLGEDGIWFIFLYHGSEIGSNKNKWQAWVNAAKSLINCPL